MKAPLSLFLVIFLTMISSVSQANHQNQTDTDVDKVINYCYKPGKPLIFASSDYKARYIEDMQEYENCRQNFLEMQAWFIHMRHESEKNTQLMHEHFLNKHY